MCRDNFKPSKLVQAVKLLTDVERGSVRISAGAPAILTYILVVFSVSLGKFPDVTFSYATKFLPVVNKSLDVELVIT